MAMDHAEAHERIADLALDRDGLDRIDAAGRGDTVDPAFVAHVRGCPTCRADLAAIRSVDQRLRDALANVRDVAAIQPINPPDSLRDAVLSAARTEPRHAPRTGAAPAATSLIARPRRLALPAWSVGRWATALVAALVIAVLGGIAGRGLAPAATSPDPSMVAAVGTLDRVLVAPDRHVVSLTTPAGVAAGTVAWSAKDFVVLTSALPAPQAGTIYRCWLQWSGKFAAVGSMDFAGPTAYWTGATGEWADLLAEPGTRFVVSAEPAGQAGEAPSGGILLQAGLAS